MSATFAAVQVGDSVQRFTRGAGVRIDDHESAAVRTEVER